MANKRKGPPPLNDFWGQAFIDKEVQNVLKEARDWRLPRRELSAYLFRAYDSARAFAEHPSKRFVAVGEFLTPFDWYSNGWFFRLCAAICSASEQRTIEDQIAELAAETVGESKPLLAIQERLQYMGIVYSPEAIGVIITRQRKARQQVADDWLKWDPQFFTAGGHEGNISKNTNV